MKRTTIKSVWAVVAGFLAIIVLSSAVDMILEGVGVFPSVEEQQEHGFNEFWMQALTLFYRVIFTVLGGIVTAKLAPRHPMRHILALVIIGVIVGTAGSVAVHASLGIFPVWYSVALVAIGPPSAWIGGKLATGSPT